MQPLDRDPPHGRPRWKLRVGVSDGQKRWRPAYASQVQTMDFDRHGKRELELLKPKAFPNSFQNKIGSSYINDDVTNVGHHFAQNMQNLMGNAKDKVSLSTSTSRETSEIFKQNMKQANDIHKHRKKHYHSKKKFMALRHRTLNIRMNNSPYLLRRRRKRQTMKDSNRPDSKGSIQKHIRLHRLSDPIHNDINNAQLLNDFVIYRDLLLNDINSNLLITRILNDKHNNRTNVDVGIGKTSRDAQSVTRGNRTLVSPLSILSSLQSRRPLMVIAAGTPNSTEANRRRRINTEEQELNSAKRLDVALKFIQAHSYNNIIHPRKAAYNLTNSGILQKFKAHDLIKFKKSGDGITFTTRIKRSPETPRKAIALTRGGCLRQPEEKDLHTNFQRNKEVFHHPDKLYTENQMEQYQRLLWTSEVERGVWRRIHVVEAEITVIVKDINDNSPTFPKSVIYGDVQENGPIGKLSINKYSFKLILFRNKISDNFILSHCAEHL